MNRDHVFKYLI